MAIIKQFLIVMIDLIELQKCQGQMEIINIHIMQMLM